MKRIITVHHPQSEDHVNEMVSSWTDWPLTDIGRARADAIGVALKSEFGRGQFSVFCSDLSRAAETADIIGNYLGARPVPRTGLRDIHAGSATGKPQDWLQLHQLPAQDGVSTLDYRGLDDAESYRELLRRVNVVLDEILALPDENVLVVAHGETLSALYFLWAFGMSEMFGFVRFCSEPGGVSVLTLDDGTKSIQKLNDMSYQKGARF